MKYNKEFFEANLIGILMEKGKDWSQARLARETGIDAPNLNKYIKGKLNLTEPVLNTIAKALEVYPESLLQPNSKFNNQLKIMKEYLNEDGLSGDELKERANSIMNVLPEEQQGRIQDEKNADSDLTEIVVKHPRGKRIITVVCILAFILYVIHPSPIVDLLSLMALCIVSFFLGKSIKHRKWIDKFL